MKFYKRVKRILSKQTLSHIRYLPAIIASLDNWPLFLYNYLGFQSTPAVYRFNNGLILNAKELCDTQTIAVIFMKKDYGTIAQDSTVVDIGANIGIFSVYAANQGAKRVIAFEPMPDNITRCVAHFCTNTLQKNITLFGCGVADRTGEQQLHLGLQSAFHSFIKHPCSPEAITVSTLSLEDSFKRSNITHCDLLKIDCEGAEYAIFYAAPEATLARIKEIRLEYHEIDEEQQNGKALETFLQTKGFVTTLHIANHHHSGILWLKRED